MSDTAPKNTGKIRVDAFALKKLLMAKGWTQEELVESSLVSKQTVQRLMQGGTTRMSTLRDIASSLGARPLDLVHPSEYEPPATGEASPQAEGDWRLSEPLGPMRTASNGLVYRVFRMQHRSLPTRFGRGKRYELFELVTDEKERLRTQLLRHTEVCDAVGRCPQLPVCYATYPDPSDWVWWVIDEWVEGTMLAEQLTSGPVPLANVAQWAFELAQGIAAMHSVGVIRRELNPSNILVRKDDDSLLLTDFELAKLVGNGPTVSKDWPEEDPYLAPEIGAGAPTPAADLYSWARVVTHLVAGKAPPRGDELAALQRRLSSRIAQVIAECAVLPPSSRRQSVDEILPAVRQWAQESGDAV